MNFRFPLYSSIIATVYNFLQKSAALQQTLLTVLAG